MGELHLFIIWHNARQKEKKLLQEIANKFDIAQTFDITWSEELFSENLTRFYGKKLPKSDKKKEQCGTGSFLVIPVIDHNPLYEKGTNKNIIELKYKLRRIAKGINLIHGSDNKIETEENMMFLLGLTIGEFSAKYPQKKLEPIKINSEIIGAPEWKNENELVTFAKKIPQTTIHKLRDTHMITTENVYKTSRLLNANKRVFMLKRNLYHIPIDGGSKPIYIRKIAA